MGRKELKLCTVGKKYFVLGRLEQPRQNKNLLYRHDLPNEPTKKGPLSFVLLESPFTSISTVSRGHPSQVSLLGRCSDPDRRNFSLRLKLTARRTNNFLLSDNDLVSSYILRTNFLQLIFLLMKRHFNQIITRDVSQTASSERDSVAR